MPQDTRLFGVLDNRTTPATLLVTGPHDECVTFMRTLYDQGQKPVEDFDLHRVEDAGNGMFVIGIPVSYVL